jgi:hypothetical protein
VIFQSRDNAKALSLSANTSSMAGTIYALAAQLSESGNAQLNASVVVDTLLISGNGIADVHVALGSPVETAASGPAQVATAYGIASVAPDALGQSIAIVDTDDNPNAPATLVPANDAAALDALLSRGWRARFSLVADRPRQSIKSFL